MKRTILLQQPKKNEYRMQAYVILLQMWFNAIKLRKKIWLRGANDFASYRQHSTVIQLGSILKMKLILVWRIAFRMWQENLESVHLNTINIDTRI